MSEKQDLGIGKIIQGEAFRDAIHIAVAPLIAGEDLNPSERVILSNGEAFARIVGGPPPIGIVDPFLEDCVLKGQKFWLFLYPNTITSLRHTWTHPTFKRTSIQLIEDSLAKAVRT